MNYQSILVVDSIVCYDIMICIMTLVQVFLLLNRVIMHIIIASLHNIIFSFFSSLSAEKCYSLRISTGQIKNILEGKNFKNSLEVRRVEFYQRNTKTTRKRALSLRQSRLVLYHHREFLDRAGLAKQLILPAWRHQPSAGQRAAELTHNAKTPAQKVVYSL